MPVAWKKPLRHGVKAIQSGETLATVSKSENETIRNPMSYTLGTAARATGKSKTTIQRAILKGLISASKGKNGRYSIDPSELHRVFPKVNSETVPGPPKVDSFDTPDETLFQVKIEALETMLEREREALFEMRADRDAWKQQATALLGSPEKKRRGWWPFG